MEEIGVNLCNTGAVIYPIWYPDLTLFGAEIKSEIMLLLGYGGSVFEIVCIPFPN